MKYGIILGTRPEIIKLSPVIRYLEKKKLNHFIIHTNQHFSKNMDEIFFKELKLPSPKYNLKINQMSHAKMTGNMLIKIEEILLQEKPTIVLVQGDTNTVLAGALCASKMNIKVGHIEAGLRSYNKNMPEEINRIITDHVSDYLFTPTNLQKEILLKENINNNKIFVTGNTIVDAISNNIKIAEDIRHDKYDYDYLILTFHRQENVDIKSKLENVFKGIQLIYQKYKYRIIFPIHPRTKKKINEFQIDIPNCIEIVEPEGYFKFLNLMKNAKLILTDSGGIQEEACIMKIPCLTLRKDTERPETVNVGSNILVGTNPHEILKNFEIMICKNKEWVNPFGDGRTAERIIKIIKNHDKI